MYVSQLILFCRPARLTYIQVNIIYAIDLYRYVCSSFLAVMLKANNDRERVIFITNCFVTIHFSEGNIYQWFCINFSFSKAFTYLDARQIWSRKILKQPFSYCSNNLQIAASHCWIKTLTEYLVNNIYFIKTRHANHFIKCLTNFHLHEYRIYRLK